VDTRIVANKGGKKTDIKKLGMNSIKEGVVKNNLMGVSKYMDKKGWVDAQGNKGKVGLALFVTHRSLPKHRVFHRC
jgi:hypothetical protein